MCKMQFSIDGKKAALDVSPSLPIRRLQRGVLAMRTSVLAEVDLNQLRLGLFALRKSQRQHAVLVLGMDLFRVNGARQRERAGERAVGPLRAVEAALLDLVFELALALEIERVVFDSNFNVLGIDARELGLHDQVVVGLVDVNCRSPSPGPYVFIALPLEGTPQGVVENAVEMVLRGQ